MARRHAVSQSVNRVQYIRDSGWGTGCLWETGFSDKHTHSSRIVPFVSVAVVGSGAYSFATTVAINFQGKFMMFCEAGGRELLDTLRMVN